MADDPYDVISYQIYCNVEMAYVGPIPRFRYQGAPTLCPNDHADRTNFTNVVALSIDRRKSVISNEPTTGIFEAQLKEMSVPSGSIGDKTSFTFTYANNIEVWATAIDITPDMVGDRVTICVAPGAVIGMLTVPVSSGTVLDVPYITVNSPYVFAGSIIELYDPMGMQLQNVGYLVSIDKDNYQLHVQTAVAFSFPAGTLVRMYNYMLQDYRLSSQGYREFGRKGLRSKMIPLSTPIVYTVENNTGTAKTHYAHIEFYKN